MIDNFLDPDMRLKAWPSKQNNKLLAVEYLSTKFEFKKIYSEKEVNGILKNWHTFSDWPMLRRELYERGYLSRNLSGSVYMRIK